MASSDSDSSLSSSDASKRGIKRKREDITVADQAVTVGGAKAAEADDSSGSDSSADNKKKHNDQVLSHAAQRKLKKKAEKAAAKGDSPDAEKTADAQKRQNSVWVGNLAFKTTEQAIRGFFQRGVPGCEITRVNMPTKTGRDIGGGKGMRGENRGFAYVDFTKEETKALAIALSEQHLDGRKLLIKDGDDFTGRPTATVAVGENATGMSKTAQKILATQKQPAAPTLFLGNLGFQTTEDSIRSMLEGHMAPRPKKPSKDKTDIEKDKSKKEDTADETKIGTEFQTTEPKKWIRKIRLGTFEDTGNCKGWAFVDFHNVEDATAVLINPRNHNLDGRKLVVEYASAEAVRRGGGPGAKSHRDAKVFKEGKMDNRRTTKHDQEESNGDREDFTARDVRKTDTDNEGPIAKKAKKIHMKDSERQGNARRAKHGAALALAHDKY
ncbi:RNA-binding domain-containing protein [Hysterangium stoloniferum]|nr:RNA-binding domain-containing protein [Hysterangium stoloniferum]